MAPWNEATKLKIYISTTNCLVSVEIERVKKGACAGKVGVLKISRNAIFLL